MDINVLANQLGKLAKVKKVSDSKFEIDTGARINAHNPITIYLTEKNGALYFSDHKMTLKYMSQIYELKSIDVKNCIAAVIKHYGFNVISGELFSQIKSDASLIETYYNIIMCIGQLAHMYVFFDNP